MSKERIISVQELLIANIQEIVVRSFPELAFFAVLTNSNIKGGEKEGELGTPMRAQNYMLTNIARPAIYEERHAVQPHERVPVTSEIYETPIPIIKIKAESGFAIKTHEASATNIAPRATQAHISYLIQDLRRQIHNFIFRGPEIGMIRYVSSIPDTLEGKFLAALKAIDAHDSMSERIVFLSSDMKWDLINADNQKTLNKRFICISRPSHLFGRWLPGKANKDAIIIRKITVYAARARWCAGMPYATSTSTARPTVDAGGLNLFRQSIKEAFQDVLVYIKTTYSSPPDIPSADDLNKTKLAIMDERAIIADIKNGKFAYEAEFEKQVRTFSLNKYLTESDITNFEGAAAAAMQREIKPDPKERAAVIAARNKLYADLYVIAYRLDGAVSSTNDIVDAVKTLLVSKHGMAEAEAGTLATQEVTNITVSDFPKIVEWPTKPYHPIIRLRNMKIPPWDVVVRNDDLTIDVRVDGLGMEDNQIRPGDIFEFFDYWDAEIKQQVVAGATVDVKARKLVGEAGSQQAQPFMGKIMSAEKESTNLMQTTWRITFMPIEDPCGLNVGVDRMIRPYMKFKINTSNTSMARVKNRNYGAICSPNGLFLMNLVQKSDLPKGSESRLTTDVNGITFEVTHEYDTSSDLISYIIRAEMGVSILDENAIVVFSCAS